MEKKEKIIFFGVSLVILVLFIIVERKELFPEKYTPDKTCLVTCNDVGQKILNDVKDIPDEYRIQWLKNCAYLYQNNEDPFKSDKCIIWEK